MWSSVVTLIFISIHAPREGGDPQRHLCSSCTAISIHAPREGGDKTRVLKIAKQKISIHAPREGGDSWCYVEEG